MYKRCRKYESRHDCEDADGQYRAAGIQIANMLSRSRKIKGGDVVGGKSQIRFFET